MYKMELKNVDIDLGEGLASNEEDLMRAVKYVTDTLNAKGMFGHLVVRRTDDNSLYLETDIGVKPVEEDYDDDYDDYEDDYHDDELEDEVEEEPHHCACGNASEKKTKAVSDIIESLKILLY